MWTSIFINIIISLIIIFVFHSFWNNIKNTYSVKKTKDLVSFQTQKYKSIIDEIQENTRNKGFLEIGSQSSSENTEKNNLEMDLEKFLQETIAEQL